MVVSDGAEDEWVDVEVSGITSGVWYHIVFWHDPVADQIGMSINNGTPITSAWSLGITTPITDSTNRLWVGAYALSTPAYFTDGIIDELSIWNSVLTADEREWLYNSGDGRTYDDLQDGTSMVGKVFIII